ncbi:MAG TPA: DUF5134 domain-containing protein [Actinomycetospora sp.]|jgi:hypothetical protein|uniref:DUF5134 domain-containing protein n=1 Tax=Actinomycetospora sp. TaxID=1872135 RepID=UPI002F41C064
MVDGWFGMTVATVFVLTTALCAVSLATHRPRHAPRIAAAEANHVVMGVAMVVMVTPTTAGLVPPVLGAVIFGLAGVGWLAALVVTRRRGEALGSAIGVDRCTAHPTHLFLLDAAMLVMYLAMAPATTPVAEMPGTDMAGMPGMDTPATPPMGLLVLAAMLALYLVAHAVATVVVVVRRARVEQPAAAVVGTPTGTEPAGTGGVAVAVAPAPAVPRAVSVLAHGPVQLIGQAGMSLAMAAMLCLL